MGPIDDRDLIPLRPAFDIVRRGYDRAQVDYRVEELQACLRITTADSEAAAAQAAELTRQLEAVRQELDEARREVQRLGAPPDTVEGLSERLKRMLRLAQNEAAEIIARAEKDAVTRRATAEQEASGLRTRYEEMISETKRRRSEMETEHQQVLTEARQQATELVTEARRKAGDLGTAAAAQRKQVEEDFEITMSARRTEAMRALTEQEQTSKVEAQRRVAEATEAARRVVTEADRNAVALVDEATRRVDQLRMVRGQIAEQLQSVQSMLDTAVQELVPTPQENSVCADERPSAPADATRTNPGQPAIHAVTHQHSHARSGTTLPWQRS